MRKKLTLPKPVKIGAHTWKFKRMLKTPKEGAPYEPQYGDFGCCDYSTHIIWIAPHSGTQLAETVFHEITHAINEMTGVQDGATEEHFTTQSAKGWVAVLKDNPHILEYIREQLSASA